MTLAEFSDSFDVLYNNISSNTAPGINSYEKSVLLTKAQDELVKNYFNPKGNKYQEGFEDSAKRYSDFSTLIQQYSSEYYELTGRNEQPFDPRGKKFQIPADVIAIINESIVTNNGVKQVIPIDHNEYTRLMSRPYKEPLKYQAWRIIGSSYRDIAPTVEIIANTSDTIRFYNFKYIRKPKPIILVDLTKEYGEGISIDGETAPSECELGPVLHQELLQRAVELAKVTYLGDANGLLNIGQRSE